MKEAGVSRRIDRPENSRHPLHRQPSSCAGCSPVVRNTLETAQEQDQPFWILERRRCALLIWKVSPKSHTQVLADNNVRPWCVHRLQAQSTQTNTAWHWPRWRNGRTSTGRHCAARRSTQKWIIPPTLNQRVRGSSPWRRTPPYPADLRCLRETASRHPRLRGVVHPWCIHRSATCRTTLASAWPGTAECIPLPSVGSSTGPSTPPVPTRLRIWGELVRSVAQPEGALLHLAGRRRAEAPSAVRVGSPRPVRRTRPPPASLVAPRPPARSNHAEGSARRRACDDDPGAAVLLELSHRPQASLQPTVIRLDTVVGVLVSSMAGCWRQLLEHTQVHRRVVGDDLNRGDLVVPMACSKNRRAALRSHRGETNTSTTWPN
jgi:hypothetical protein